MALKWEEALKDMTEIRPNLFLSAVSAISDANLAQNGITLIINATKELPIFPVAAGSHIESVRVPVYDATDQTLYPYFEPICQLIHANNDLKKGATLIHCVAGRSRSASLCIAYLLWKNEGQSKANNGELYKILDNVQKLRPIVQPNMAFMGQLVSWENELKGIQSKESKGLTDKEKSAINEIVHLTERIKSTC